MHFNWWTPLKEANADIIGDDVFLLDNSQFLPLTDYPIKLDFTLTLICTKGRINGTINLKDFTMDAPCLLIIIRGQIFHFKSLSQDFSCKMIGYSEGFLTNLLSGPQERLPLFLSVFENPVISLNEENLNDFGNYYNMLQRAVRKKQNPYRLETVKHLTQALFYDSSNTLHRIPENKKKNRHEVLMEDFLNLVRLHYRKEREVGFYANKLRLTPKYLSKLIKENSHKSANDWINEQVVLEMKALLKSSEMNIQQISDHLHFPSQSFMGKYFKRHVGKSPKEYKRS